MLNFRGSVYFRNWISYSLPLLGGSILIVNPGSVLIINQQPSLVAMDHERNIATFFYFITQKIFNGGLP